MVPAFPRWPGYQASPLQFLGGLAAAAGVGSVAYQDESQRFGLSSFKALGGAYAVYRHLARAVADQTGQSSVSARSLMAGEHRDLTSRLRRRSWLHSKKRRFLRIALAITPPSPRRNPASPASPRPSPPIPRRR